MKTLFTAYEALDNNAKPKQAQMDMGNLDITTLLMVKNAFIVAGLADYVELEMDNENAFLRIFEGEGKPVLTWEML